jgi:L-aminopeptidase/D-esterase-like protein
MAGSLTSIAGIRVGHAHDGDALTGCTVILLPPETVGAVDVRGGAPGTRETDLLAPQAMVQHVNALCLAGGSAYGLAAATGVMAWLNERDIGFDVRVAKVPIVPAAVLFDLAMGRADCWPDAAMGYAACDAAHADVVEEGCVGAGIGAAVGKLLGMSRATKGGLGSAAITLPDGATVAALAVTNAFGDVRRDNGGEILAGARTVEGRFADSARLLRELPAQLIFSGGNTTLVVVATDAKLDKAACTKLAEMAQDGLARTIRPIHTPFDGDVVFAVATGSQPAPHLVVLGSAAADVVATAIERSVLQAVGMGGIPAATDLLIS